MRDELIAKVARAAHDAHYCATGASGELCKNCLDDGRSNCFELSGGFDLNDQQEWQASAEAAIEVVETVLKIKIT